MGRPTVGSLFSGIGGLDLGLERAGFKVRWQVEIDDYCRRVLTRHWPDVPKYGDIAEVEIETLEAVDLIAGGFPCQPFSLAGKRRGKTDSRNLWPQMLRIVREIRPMWVLGENTPGLRDYLDEICDGLEASGYEVLPLEVPAAAFEAAHLRYRTFIIAHLDPSRIRQQSVLGAGSASAGVTPDTRTTRAVADAAGFRRGEGWTESVVGREAGISRPDWPAGTGMVRGFHGIPRRMDRIRALGNAVVPQVAEWVGRRIIEAMNDKE